MGKKITLSVGGVKKSVYDTETKKVTKIDQNKPLAVSVVKPEYKRKPVGIARLFPSKKFTCMRFTYSGGLTSSTSQSVVGSSNVFNLNNINGPKVLSPSYRPQGYDQIVNIYKRYKVYACRVRVTFSNATQDGLFCVARLYTGDDTDSVAGETLGVASMKKWTWSKPVNHSGSQVVIYERYCDIRKMEGLTKAQMSGDIDRYSASINANPTVQPGIEVGVANTADATGAQIAYLIEMDYYLQLYDRHSLPASAI